MFALFRYDIIELSRKREKIYESIITAHSSQLTAHADYVSGSVFCQPLKQAFSHFCEKAFYVECSELFLEKNGEEQYA